MSRKSKIEPALKVELVERYLKEEIALREAARRAGLKREESFAHWVSVYLSEGVVGLLRQAKKKASYFLHKPCIICIIIQFF